MSDFLIVLIKDDSILFILICDMLVLSYNYNMKCTQNNE